MEEKGRIIGLSGGLYTVRCDTQTLVCYAKGSFRRGEMSPMVGDVVTVSLDAKLDKKEERMGARGLITQILPRKNALIRPPLANLDTLFLVTAVKDPDPILLSLDKLCAIARHNGIEAIPVFTKKELDPEKADELVRIYCRAGFSAVAVTSLDKEEAKELLYPKIQGTLCAMAGASGVGKSTLIITLFPIIGAQTGLLSQKSQ